MTPKKPAKAKDESKAAKAPKAAKADDKKAEGKKADAKKADAGKPEGKKGAKADKASAPVEIEAPAGASVSLAVDDQFTPPTPAPLKAGMLIGSVYWMRVTGIPRRDAYRPAGELAIVRHKE